MLQGKMSDPLSEQQGHLFASMQVIQEQCIKTTALGKLEQKKELVSKVVIHKSFFESACPDLSPSSYHAGARTITKHE